MTALAIGPEWLVFIATVIVALCGVGGTLGGAWISKQAANRTAEIEKRRVSLDEFEQLKNFLREQIADQAKKIEAQEALIKQQADNATRLAAGVESLKYAMALEQHHRREAERRVDQLIQVMQTAEMEVPPAFPPSPLPPFPSPSAQPTES